MVTDPLNFQSILDEVDGKWDGLPKGIVMGHIHLSITDLAATEAFYTDALGFDVVARYGMQALFISTGKYHHHIGLNTWHSAGGVKAPETALFFMYRGILCNKLMNNLTSFSYPEFCRKHPYYNKNVFLYK